MKIRLIALDLDGTLLDPDKRVSARSREALRQAAAMGIHVVPATGRFYKGMPAAVRELPFVRYVITINGAQVWDAAEGKSVCRAEIPMEQAERLFDFMDALPVIYDCYQDDWGWMDRKFYEQIDGFIDDRFELDMARNLRSPVDDFRAELRRRNRPVQKSQMFFRDVPLRNRVLEAMPALFPALSVSSATSINIEVNDRDAQKGTALRRLCAALGVDPSEAMAFGDNLNDLTMIEAAGVGVAMGNACGAVKDAAQLVTAANDDEGVAKALEQYVL